jgi:hypothetical protein
MGTPAHEQSLARGLSLAMARTAMAAHAQIERMIEIGFRPL